MLSERSWEKNTMLSEIPSILLLISLAIIVSFSSLSNVGAEEDIVYSFNANLNSTWPNNGSVSTGFYYHTDPAIEVRPILVIHGSHSLDFFCGFITNGTANSFFFGVFAATNLSKIKERGLDTRPSVVWVGNRDRPITEDGTLQLTHGGDLILRDADGSMVWSTNTSGQSITGMRILESGNLVLSDKTNNPVWQSFEHPTDTLLIGQQLAVGQSLKSSALTRKGEYYYLSLGIEGLAAYIDSNPPQTYYRREANGCKYASFINESLGLICADGKHVTVAENYTTVQFMRLDADGHLRVYEWGGEWRMMKDIFEFIQVPGSWTMSTKGRSNFRTILAANLGGLMAVFVIASVCIVVYRRKRRSAVEEEEKEEEDEEEDDECFDNLPNMPVRFSYGDMKTVTAGFSKKLGQGGFGSVYEGVLADGMRVAVKQQLAGIGQRRKEFLAEVRTVGSIHHLNLVKLIGFCAEKSRRLLVYEYMPNGSLDKWIYSKYQKPSLSWKTRKNIILDIAKGLTYLHEECRQRIAHLDVKPQNILLDNNFNAKVSDFGLSKLIDRDQSHVVTTIRGTLGYLAPEWLSSVITEKVDVYSFGVVLLEIVCGRRNVDYSQEEGSVHLLSLLEKKAEEGRILEIISHCNGNMLQNEEEATRMIRVAVWCLQWDCHKRPSMSMVVKVLEGVLEVETDLDFNVWPIPIHSEAQQEALIVSAPQLETTLSGPR